MIRLASIAAMQSFLDQFVQATVVSVEIGRGSAIRWLQRLVVRLFDAARRRRRLDRSFHRHCRLRRAVGMAIPSVVGEDGHP